MDKTRRQSCRVLIFDDQTSKAEALRNSLRGLSDQLDVHAPGKKEIESLFDELYHRRQAIDGSKPLSTTTSEIDRADVLIVDFDLRDLEDHRGFATGEEIAYSARLFSQAKVIVVVNHPNIGLNNFDLTLQRDREFRADVYVGYEQCSNPGLWLPESGHQGFLPWGWTPLVEDVRTFDECLDQVRTNLESPILKYFGLDLPDSRPSPELLAYLGLKRDEDSPIQEILGKPSVGYVRERDRVPLMESPERYARVVTALLRKWFRRWIVPAQTLLADLPHLAVVLPWSLQAYKEPGLWHRLSECGRTFERCNLETLVAKPVVQNAFVRSEWIGRPAFFLARTRDALEDAKTFMSSFSASQLPQLAFAEDLSRFINVAEAVEYNLTLDGESQIRSVSAAGKVRVDGKKFGLERIVYSPESLIL